jgi:hypothetical protein
MEKLQSGASYGNSHNQSRAGAPSFFTSECLVFHQVLLAAVHVAILGE